MASKGNFDTKRITLVSTADLSTSQYLFAKISGDNECAAAGAGEDAIGVVMDGGSASGDKCAIGIGPLVPVTLNATLSAGAEVMSDASHKAVAWVTANRSLGYLVEGGVAGDVVKMLLVQNGRKA